jgi:hypothetical protein
MSVKGEIVLHDTRYYLHKKHVRIMLSQRAPNTSDMHYVICHYVNNAVAATYYAGTDGEHASKMFNAQNYTYKVMRDVGI